MTAEKQLRQILDALDTARAKHDLSTVQARELGAASNSIRRALAEYPEA